MPYSFSSGAKLFEEAKSFSPGTLNLHVCEMTQMQSVRSFLRVVKQCQNESLDGLLEHRPSQEVEVGKHFMAAQLLKQEYLEINGNLKDRNKETDWFRYLFSRMVERTTTLEEFCHKNSVTFVTYNYDRLVEYKLINGLQAYYNRPIKECVNALERIKVIHLHGSLGPLYGGQFNVPYGCMSGDNQSFEQLKCEYLPHAALGIQIVSQANPTTSEFAAARDALAKAERVIFLGFAFGQQNVDRLGFNNINPNAQIRLTSFGMASSEYDLYVVQPFKKYELQFENRTNLPPSSSTWDCLDLLRERIAMLITRYG